MNAGSLLVKVASTLPLSVSITVGAGHGWAGRVCYPDAVTIGPPSLDLSVLAPARDERENVGPLVEAITPIVLLRPVDQLDRHDHRR